MNETNSERSSAHRIFGVFRAPETAAIWLLVVLIGFFGAWSWLERHNKALQEKRSVLEFVASDDKAASYRLKYRGATPRYVAIYVRYEGETPELLFPRLGTPRGLPWPLPAGDDFAIPGDKTTFRFRADKSGIIIVVTSELDRPLLPSELWQEEQDSDEGTIEKVHYKIFKLMEGKPA